MALEVIFQVFLCWGTRKLLPRHLPPITLRLAGLLFPTFKTLLACASLRPWSPHSAVVALSLIRAGVPPCLLHGSGFPWFGILQTERSLLCLVLSSCFAVFMFLFLLCDHYCSK